MIDKDWRFCSSWRRELPPALCFSCRTDPFARFVRDSGKPEGALFLDPAAWPVDRLRAPPRGRSDDRRDVDLEQHDDDHHRRRDDSAAEDGSGGCAHAGGCRPERRGCPGARAAPGASSSGPRCRPRDDDHSAPAGRFLGSPADRSGSVAQTLSGEGTGLTQCVGRRGGHSRPAGLSGTGNCWAGAPPAGTVDFRPGNPSPFWVTSPPRQNPAHRRRRAPITIRPPAAAASFRLPRQSRADRTSAGACRACRCWRRRVL